MKNSPAIRRWYWLLLVAGAALAMGIPTLSGSFVGGDDRRLVLNHVLVNHPSLEHAVKLFGIVHRDLYQPLPLLSFQLEFALGIALNLFSDGVEQGEWLFHLDNVLLHAVNAVLVWLLVVRLTERRVVQIVGESGRQEPFTIATATVAALVFAVHPLQVEVVAWINGRMMLLSTLFGLAAMLSLVRWLHGRPEECGSRSGGLSRGANAKPPHDRRDFVRNGHAPGEPGSHEPNPAAALCAAIADENSRKRSLARMLFTVAMVLCCMMSKVRVGVPFIMLIVALSRRSRIDRRFWLLWSVCTLLTALFVGINMWTTAQMRLFEVAGEHMEGPRLVRVLLSLGWYLKHYVWPTGLASWYPAPDVVHWLELSTLGAGGVCALAVLGVWWGSRRTPLVFLAALWFVLTIADTLPIIPARNLLAADRYMYLPIIGLAWLTGLAGACAYRKAVAAAPRLANVGAIGAGTVLILSLILICWHVGTFYETSILKTTRIAKLFPDTPHVFSRVGWSYHKAANAQPKRGNHEEAARLHRIAIEYGMRELNRENTAGHSEACQVIGSSLQKIGRNEEALTYLQKAIELAPGEGEPIFRMAYALDQMGRYEEALSWYEQACERAPGYNPAVLQLADIYRRLGRIADARARYAQALDNNPYEVPAVLALSELDIQEGTTKALNRALTRLEQLLRWMPENVAARISRGVALYGLERVDEAIAAYEGALNLDSNNPTAAINLAQIYLARSQREQAARLFQRAAMGRPELFDQIVTIEQFYLSSGQPQRAAMLWDDYGTRFPASMEARVHLAWCHAQTGSGALAEEIARSVHEARRSHPLLHALDAYLALTSRRYESAIQAADLLCADEEPAGRTARSYLLAALERFDLQHPEVPWTYHLVTQLLLAEGNLEAARWSLDLFATTCSSEHCETFRRALAAKLAP